MIKHHDTILIKLLKFHQRTFRETQVDTILLNLPQTSTITFFAVKGTTVKEKKQLQDDVYKEVQRLLSPTAII